MIGYYVHHHGHGHLHRAQSIARHLYTPVTGISSLAAPGDWPGDWLELPRDDASPTAPTDPGAGGRLHWAPLDDPGLRSRMTAFSRWLDQERPELVVVDVSVEVALLVRLHGIPVVTVAVPGARGDAAHRLGYDVSTTIIGSWPRSAHHHMVTGLDTADLDRIQPLGAISRFPVARLPAANTARTVVVLLGSGGDDLPVGFFDRARNASSSWDWMILGGASGAWLDDPWSILRSATVVVTHAGQNALAEVAAARRPAIVIPQDRPHREQLTTARALSADPHWPVEVIDPAQPQDWDALLARVSRLEGGNWSQWCDGHGAERHARAIEESLRLVGTHA